MIQDRRTRGTLYLVLALPLGALTAYVLPLAWTHPFNFSNLIGVFVGWPVLALTLALIVRGIVHVSGAGRKSGPEA
jgi:hypothetical protein